MSILTRVTTLASPDRTLRAHHLDADHHRRFLPLYLVGFFHTGEAGIRDKVAFERLSDTAVDHAYICNIFAMIQHRINRGPTPGKAATHQFRTWCL